MLVGEAPGELDGEALAEPMDEGDEEAGVRAAVGACVPLQAESSSTVTTAAPLARTREPYRTQHE